MRAVQAEIIIRSSPSNVLQAFLEQAPLQGWWGVARSLVEPRAGGVWCLAWDISEAGIKYISSGVIEAFIPDEYLKIGNLIYLNPDREILGPMELTIRFERIDEMQVKVMINQSGYQYGGDWDWYYDAVTQAWPYALGLLKVYLEK